MWLKFKEGHLWVNGRSRGSALASMFVKSVGGGGSTQVSVQFTHMPP